MSASSGFRGDHAARIAALLGSLAHSGTIATDTVTLPSTGTAVTVSRPIDTNLLLDQSVADPEQNLPYWSEIWPSGLALAAAIEHHPDRIRGRRVLELGCGLGITAALAVQHGARLTAVDYATEAITLTRVTALHHTGREPDYLRQVNWRGDTVHTLVRDGRFDIVLAADLLYERRDIAPLVTTMDTLLTDDGALWLAEPGREPAHIFLKALGDRGWTDESTRWHGPWPDPNDAGVVVHTHWLRRYPKERP